MPFKLRLRKTRHYNVLSRNVLVLNVDLIDKTTLECTLSADSTGLDCLHNVCQRVGLQQPEFFGLRYMSKRPYPKVRWVELERPLKKQLDKYAQSPALSLAVQYYIHDVGLLQDDISRSHYFLQVKQDVFEGKLRCNYEQAVLLASYSLQAEFGDHQQERHTPEYLKEFRLFPKQSASEGEVSSLLEAVVWQYSSLTGLAQALAETYYILEAQRLPGYGQETFIARDETQSEVYLGASLLGIIVQPASGEVQTFYRWNDITILVNHKRTFGLESSRYEDTVTFTFDEPDAAKYVWKMCVKQHTFFKGNQDILEVAGGMETRSLAIPDLQSSVMPKPAAKNYNSMGNTVMRIHQPKQAPDNTVCSQNFNLSTIRNSIKRNLLPHYRPTPDYETALIQKYGPAMNSQAINPTLMYSSQTDLSTQKNNNKEDRDVVQSYTQYRPYPDLAIYDDRISNQNQTRTNMLNANTLHSTYSTPELANSSYTEVNSPPKQKVNLDTGQLDYHFIHGYNPPPPYPYSKASSTSTPDLVSAQKEEEQIPTSNSYRKGSLLTASLGCLGSPEMSRTYENLTDLNDAVESLRKELTRTSGQTSSFLHSFSPNYSRDDLEAIYQLSSGQVAISSNNQNLNRTKIEPSNEALLQMESTGLSSFPKSTIPEEPIYQNISTLFTEDTKNRTKSAPELDVIVGEHEIDNRTAVLGHPQALNITSNLNKSFATQLTSNQARLNRQDILNKNDVVQQHKLKTQNSATHIPLNQVLPSQVTQANYAVGNLFEIHTNPMTQSSEKLVEAVNRARPQAANNYDNYNALKQQQMPIQFSQQQMLDYCKQANTKKTHEVNHKMQQQEFTKVAEPYSTNVKLLHQQQLKPQAHANLDSVNRSHESIEISKYRTTTTPINQNTFIMSEANQNAADTSSMSIADSSWSIHDNIFSAIRRRKKSKDKLLNSPKINSSLNTSIESSSSLQYGINKISKSSNNKDKHQKHGSRENFKPDILSGACVINSEDPQIREIETNMNSVSLQNEFESIVQMKANVDFSSAMDPQNICRNRYKDILPYEENRVKITPSKENKFGYINASHITASVGSSQRFYICSQGPLANTVNHFWQCIWETDVRLAVMLTTVVGDTQTSKSFPYWPQSDNTSVECDQYRIYRKHSTHTSSHITSRLQLVHIGKRKSRSIWHLQFTSWGEHGCPDDTQGFIDFMEELSTLRRVTYSEVEGICPNRNTPVLVHCSSGAGRSGVAILCDILLETLDHNLPLNVPKVLKHLRQHRMSLVQTFSQYKFVYGVICAYLKRSRLI